METFYTHWLNGKPIRKAFFTTQQAMRKKYAPYYWAGFTLVQ
jgi:CHAT domain-containing protein